MRVTAYARSWSLCVILSDHRIIVPHLKDNWFFFHKLYHPKLSWFIHMVHQWYCEILILVHFASDGVCQILKPMCPSEWPPYYCSTFKWQVILLSYIVPSKTLMVYTYGSVILWDLNFGSFCEWRHMPDLEANVAFWVTTVLLFHI